MVEPTDESDVGFNRKFLKS